MEYSSKKEIGKTILVIVAHPDDEVLGCGASIAKWADAGNSVHILIMAEGATSRSPIRDVSVNSEELLSLEKSAYRARDILGATSVKLLNFPDNRMDSLDLLDVIKVIEKEIRILKPYTVVTHHSGDLNIDHRIVNEAVITACRPQPMCSVRRLLSFETASSTEWQTAGSYLPFQPNYFENVSKYIKLKMKALIAYDSEMRDYPHPRSLKNVENLAKLRGSSVGFKTAEAFILLRELKRCKSDNECNTLFF